MDRKPHSLVVGGTKGLGRAVVTRFDELGHAVSVVARHVPAKPEAHNVKYVGADIRDGDALVTALEKILKQRGRLNYAVFSQRYRGETDAWAGELEVSLTATKTAIEALTPFFDDSSDCAIVLVSSVYADFVGDSQPVGYHVAKAGINQMVRYYAMNLGKRRIRVNGVVPFTFLKEESKSYYLDNKPLKGLLEEIIPLGRMGTTEDSVGLIEFLCSPRSGFINGQNIYVDGGLSVVWPENLARRITKI